MHPETALMRMAPWKMPVPVSGCMAGSVCVDAPVRRLRAAGNQSAGSVATKIAALDFISAGGYRA